MINLGGKIHTYLGVLMHQWTIFSSSYFPRIGRHVLGGPPPLCQNWTTRKIGETFFSFASFLPLSAFPMPSAFVILSGWSECKKECA